MWRVILLRRIHGSHARARRGVATAAAPRTFRVASSGPREVQVEVEGSQSAKVFPSLQEVVEAAEDGDVIELAPGRYVGGLDIDKALELRGLGEPALAESGELVGYVPQADVVELAGCQNAEFVLRSSARGVRLVNLSIIGFWKRRPCVVLSGGKSVIERCNILGGLRLEGRVRGEVWGNHLRGGHLPSIIAIDEASPHISGNHVTAGTEAGIYIGGNSYPLVEENQIYGNAEAGILVGGNSVPVIYKNRIGDNNGNGVRIESLACPTVEENEVHDNGESNICVADKSAPVLKRNKIHHSGAYGISCVHESAPIIQHNEIFGNFKPGIRIGPAATAFIRGGNEMWGNGEDSGSW